jgi:hypothetical protein
MGDAEDADDPVECRIGASAHVQRCGGQPGGVCADHRRQSLSHSALDDDASMGQLTVITPVPRRITTRLSKVRLPAARTGAAPSTSDADKSRGMIG